MPLLSPPFQRLRLAQSTHLDMNFYIDSACIPRRFLLATRSTMLGNSLSSPSRTGLTARRRKIARACDFCREHRVRCEAVTPCPPCVANNLTCRRSPSSTPRKGAPTKAIEAPGQQRSNELLANGAAKNDFQDVQAVVPTPSANLAWTSHKTDSTMGFIARINVFCSGLSHILSNPSILGSDLPLDQIPPAPTSLLPGTESAICELSPSQINHVLRLFWSHIRPQIPIVQLKDLKLSGETIPGGSSPLRDSVVAYSLLYIYNTGLHKRVVGLKLPQFQEQISSIGMLYFQRCLSTVTQLATFSGPSISAMQCYCYLTLYLLDAENHQAAYNMVGVGLRIAQSLNYMDSRNGGYRECQLFRRILWTLIQLDFRCSRHVGKPVSIRVHDWMCVRPTREPDDVFSSNGLLYHTESIRLTAAALVVNELMDRHALLSQADGPANVEERAGALSQHLNPLKLWCDELPKEQHLGKLNFDLRETDPSPGEMTNTYEESMERSSMVIILSTLLLIQYHNVMVGLHRVFIQFPSHPLVPKSNPNADSHAATALNHALTIIRIAYDRMTTLDVLHGISELYQYQWNAVITIIGFMLAYPYCHRCRTARTALLLALEVFDSAGSENATATRAAVLTRRLCDKFDTLVARLGISQPATATSPHPISEREVQSDQSYFGKTIGPVTQNHGDPPSDPSEEFLYPWADLIDLDAWSSYCDEVNGTFTNSVDFGPSFG
ncbi:hypothetical protein N7492_003146 [Penicillium capsulatum]|uniref:Zn(2)-C6 fungal-type domain-containing protein n=1 Tax=Penicillium capsulatum TaxID=69766 RepID=A0A9W9LVU6_9EURO|nr:hypothetical protein N7492_003146 [Penicillium capsulatum]KAJ6122264.1 hypothetical protein N7512_004729 [Penicillium capsulatum]